VAAVLFVGLLEIVQRGYNLAFACEFVGFFERFQRLFARRSFLGSLLGSGVFCGPPSEIEAAQHSATVRHSGRIQTSERAQF
jgi:hypothetical protein